MRVLPAWHDALLVWVAFFALIVSGCATAPLSSEESKTARSAGADASPSVQMPHAPFPRIKAPNELAIATIDVGQGFCVLILCPAPSLPILYDCGSSGSTVLGSAAQKISAQSQIAGLLAANGYVGANHVATLGALVTSHSDRDHYNWLPDVAPLAGSATGAVTFQYQAVLYSGQLGDYTLNNYVQSVAKTANAVLAKPGEEYHTGRPMNMPKPLTNNTWPIETALSCGDPNQGQYATILSVNARNPDKPNDPNPRSVVLRIQNGENAVIIGGDAEGPTYGTIYSIYQLTNPPTQSNPAAGYDSPALKATLLLAAHHGADTNQSADGLWAYLVNPGAIVFSAGTYKGYYHPRCTTLATYVNDPGPPYVHNNTPWRLLMSQFNGNAWCASESACAAFYGARANYVTALGSLGRPLPICCGVRYQGYYLPSITQMGFSTWVNGSIYARIPPSGPAFFECPDATGGTNNCSLPRSQFAQQVVCQTATGEEE